MRNNSETTVTQYVNHTRRNILVEQVILQNINSTTLLEEDF